MQERTFAAEVVHQDGVQVLTSFVCRQEDPISDEGEGDDDDESEEDSELEAGDAADTHASDVDGDAGAEYVVFAPEFVHDDDFSQAHPHGGNDEEFVSALILRTGSDDYREHMDGDAGGRDSIEDGGDGKGIGRGVREGGRGVRICSSPRNKHRKLLLQVMSRKDIVRIRDLAMGTFRPLSLSLSLSFSLSLSLTLFLSLSLSFSLSFSLSLSLSLARFLSCLSSLTYSPSLHFPPAVCCLCVRPYKSPSLPPSILLHLPPGAIFNLTTHLLPALVGCDVSAARANQAQDRGTSLSSNDEKSEPSPNDEKAAGFEDDVQVGELMDGNAIPFRQAVGKSQAGMQAGIHSDGKENVGDDIGGVVEMKDDNTGDSTEHRELSTAEVADIFAVLDRNGDGQVRLCVSKTSVSH